MDASEAQEVKRLRAENARLIMAYALIKLHACKQMEIQQRSACRYQSRKKDELLRGLDGGGARTAALWLPPAASCFAVKAGS
jgi:hypothetical protein